MFIGTPDTVSEQLQGLRDELGFDGVLELNCGGAIPHQNVLAAVKSLCQDVMPRFHLELTKLR